MTNKVYTPTDIDKCIGKTIQVLRARAGMTQKDLSAATGVTFQQIQKYESGQNRISVSRLHQIASALNIPVATLYNEANNEYAHDTGMMDLIQRIYKMSDADKKLITDIIYRMGA